MVAGVASGAFLVGRRSLGIDVCGFGQAPLIDILRRLSPLAYFARIVVFGFKGTDADF